MAGKKKRMPFAVELLQSGPEPEWDDQYEIEDSELEARFSTALGWYNSNYTSQQSRDLMFKFMKSDKTLKKQVDAISAVEAWKVGRTTESMASIAKNGCEFPSVLARYKERFDTKIEELTEEGNKLLSEKKVVKADVPKKVVVSIQERVRVVASEHIGNIEFLVDEFIDDNCKKKINLYDWLQKTGVKAGHMRHIIDYYKAQHEEIQEALKGEDEQLNEGYAFLTKPRKKKLVALYANFVSDSQEWQKDCRGKRKMRKRKVKTPKELVKKLNFKKKDEEFGIESVKAVDVLDASQVWVFDTKNRFMYKYV